LSDNVTQDFIFGTLATDELRLDAIRAEHAGFSHNSCIEPLDPEPSQPVRVTVGLGEIDAVEVFALVTTDGSDPNESSEQVPLAPGDVIWNTLFWSYRKEWTADLPPQPAGTLVRYKIASRDRDGHLTWADADPDTGDPAIFGYHVDNERVPDWIHDAIIYEIFVDRFAPGKGRTWNKATDLGERWGGKIRGVVEQLPYLVDLGVNCLWLTPVFASPTHHGYDPTDYYTVEPSLGTNEDLVELFETAHRHGIRVLLDFVASHLSNEHPIFQRAITDPQSDERAWFTFSEWPDDYRAYFGIKSLPQIKTQHPGIRKVLLDAAEYWLRQGADGYRLDYAQGTTHDFWAEFRARARAAKPDSFAVGEIVETAELQRSYVGRFDGVLDFLLLQQMRAFFAFDLIGAGDLDRFLNRHLAYFPPEFVLPSFLDNHDMNRFLWITQGDQRRLKMATLLQFTLPHPPIIYYGTEVGLSQHRDLEYPDGRRRPEEARTLMPWGDEQDHALLSFYTRLIAFRRSRPNLWRGQRRTILATNDGLLVVEITNEEQSVTIAVNRSNREVSIEYSPEAELLIGTSNEVAGLVLPPMSGGIWGRTLPSAAAMG
jgi:cyclomaltodextrinase / maltogenic alpha-amylase / neopullulanase